MNSDLSTNRKCSVRLLFLLGIILGFLWFIDLGFLFMMLISAISGYLIWHYAKPEDKKFVVTLFVTALLIRFLLGTALYFLSVYCRLGSVYWPDFTVDPLIKDRYAVCFIGDSAATSLRAWWLSQIWHDKISIDWFHSRDTLYTPQDYHFRLYAVFYYIFGFSQLGGKFINSLFSVGTAILIYYIAKDIFNRQVAKLAAILSAFFPTIILWSVTDLKEPINSFLFCLTIFSILRLIFLKKIRYLFLLIISFTNILIRYSFGIFALLFALFSLIIGLSRNKYLRLTIVLIICSITMTPLGKEKIKSAETKLVSEIDRLMVTQRGASSAGGSAYKIYPDDLRRLTSIKQLFSSAFIASVTKSFVFFLLTPFPWKISSKLQLLTYPQIILWYFLLVFALLGIIYSLRYNFKKSFFALFYLFSSTVLSGMASGNIGSAVRHRDIMMPLFLLFSAAGLTLYFSPKRKNEYRFD